MGETAIFPMVGQRKWGSKFFYTSSFNVTWPSLKFFFRPTSTRLFGPTDQQKSTCQCYLCTKSIVVTIECGHLTCSSSDNIIGATCLLQAKQSPWFTAIRNVDSQRTLSGLRIPSSSKVSVLEQHSDTAPSQMVSNNMGCFTWKFFSPTQRSFLALKLGGDKGRRVVGGLTHTHT